MSLLGVNARPRQTRKFSHSHAIGQHLKSRCLWAELLVFALSGFACDFLCRELCLELCRFEIEPRRGATYQPKATPWVMPHPISESPERALHHPPANDFRPGRSCHTFETVTGGFPWSDRRRTGAEVGGDAGGAGGVGRAGALRREHLGRLVRAVDDAAGAVEGACQARRAGRQAHRRAPRQPRGLLRASSTAAPSPPTPTASRISSRSTRPRRNRPSYCGGVKTPLTYLHPWLLYSVVRTTPFIGGLKRGSFNMATRPFSSAPLMIQDSPLPESKFTRQDA